MALNELEGFGSVRFYKGVYADWIASSKILAVNEFAVVTDIPGMVVQGQALTSLQKVGPTFAQIVASSPNLVVRRIPIAINATATMTAAQMAAGGIKSTSLAATSVTTPTATQLATQLSADQGDSFKFIIDNSAGANTVTLVLGAGFTALAVITGGNTLTVAAGSVGIFEIYFKSTTAAVIGRIA